MQEKFRNRTEAGEALVRRLAGMPLTNPVVLALPRGGVPVALPVARALGAPLDLLFVRKLGAPGQPELALGAVVEGDPPQVVVNPAILSAFGVARDDLAGAVAEKTAEIARRRATYLGGRAAIPVAGRDVIVVDDGIATGATVRAGLKGLRAQAPGRIVLAVPVAPADVLDEIAALVDEVVCLTVPEPFIAVGVHYHSFDQVDDAEVTAMMRAAPKDEDRT